MTVSELQQFHQSSGARFQPIDGVEVVANYGDVAAEYAALRGTVGLMDLSFRSRLCLGGADRTRFLHGQVTNEVNKLKPGQGCYAALVTAKGKVESDFNIYRLPNELLLDFEPGLAARVTERFDKFIIADDVQIVDVSVDYGLLSVQGPRAAELIARFAPELRAPVDPLSLVAANDVRGEWYCMRISRAGTSGFDLFLPSGAIVSSAEALLQGARELGGRLFGWDALEIARIEAGIPRFGQDMDETNLASEAGIEQRAISYEKGCYIGQEVISRIRAFGQVAKALRGLRLAAGQGLPEKGAKIFGADKEVGYVTSATHSPTLQVNIALGYVRKEHNAIGTEVMVQIGVERVPAEIVALPFVPEAMPA